MHHLAYLKSLLNHKYFVVLEGHRLGLSWWQLLWHDWSKFLPDEWFSGVVYHRDGTSHIDALKKHHQRNRHHPQYWVRGDTVSPMPERFYLEMIADWRAMGRVKGTSTIEWYRAYGVKFPFHPETRAKVENILFEAVKPQ
jgi:hypothetical protein